MRKNNTTIISITGGVILALILVLGTIWMGHSAQRDTENAVHTVSYLYLDELAGRREQVVSENLQDRIVDMQTALDLLTPADLQNKESLETYQSNMKTLFTLDRFAFVDTDGLIYSSSGYQNDIDEYPFDYRTIDGPEISIKDLETTEKKVIIAMPVEIPFEDETLSVSFMEIDMKDMLLGVSMQAQEKGATLCNIYTRTGVALSNTVLGGLAMEDNLLEAMKVADFDSGYSYEDFLGEFTSGTRGIVGFTYNGIQESLSFVPVEGTDWVLTYLIRESVISDQIGTISSGILFRSIVQSLLTVAALVIMFGLIISQLRANSRLVLEKETSDAANRVKQEELEQRLHLQEKLVEETKQRERQDQLITALSSDYRAVYYLDLDKDEGICYQSHTDLEGTGFSVGDHFPYLKSVTDYANRYITDSYRDEFLRFVQPESLREGLKNSPVVSYTYTVLRHGVESYEMIRFAGVRHMEDRADGLIHNLGTCFTDVDQETRKNLAQQQALSDALATAEQASMAKTAFLSNMSHEIRTPMNAIIGLDTVALSDPETPPKTREYLKKIGSSAEHLLGLINDILDMSRIESGRMALKNEEFSFSDLIEAINTMFNSQCNDKHLEYHCHILGEVDDYYVGDNMKLRQILINILGNAVKFTPEGGRVSMEVKRTAHYEGLSTLRFVISDTGIGMSEEFLPHIFDTFAQEDSSATSKYGSSGLGLAITRNLVEMMNGTIQVRSIKGEGSVFTVTVTLTDSARQNTEKTAGEIHPEEMSVLIVDDDPIACEHAKLVLEKAGISSETASSGEKAVEMVRLRHARREPYNLILMDWQMPGMDGVEATRQIRSIVGTASAIIILTAYSWDDILEEAVTAGVDSFLPKPLFAAAVIEEFRTALEKRTATAKEEVVKAELEGRRILLAEDMQVNAEIMIMVLEMRGMEADLAENGRIAVEKFTSHPEGYYDAVLMDMRMPEMDGLEATRQIRASGRADAKTIPIIALTANAFDEDVQRSLQAGLNAHLSKPVQPEALFETLGTLIK